LVASSLATPWQVDAKDAVLYLEDVGEGVYAIERKLAQLQYAGVLDAAAAVVLGAFTNCRNAYHPDYDPEELLADFFADYSKPVVCNLRSAHCAPMTTLPMGAVCTVDADAGTVEFSF
jgi:muramoyltetrapeptide carboxypeptidase